MGVVIISAKLILLLIVVLKTRSHDLIIHYLAIIETKFTFKFIGIPLFLIGLNRLGVFLGEVYKYVYIKVFCFICNRRKAIAKNMARKKKQLKYQVSEEKFNGVIIDDLEYDEEKKVTVPLVLILLSVIGYLLIGGYFFTQLGEEWTLVQSIYGSYQAVSTIGKKTS
jgi:hypothetical protein